jgi:hypothetical protein
MGDLGRAEIVFMTVFPLAMFALTIALVAPASFKLLATIRRLVTTAQQIDPERFKKDVERANPFRTGSFDNWRTGRLLRVDFRPFGRQCEELQGECRRWNRRIYLGLIPLLATVVVMTLYTEWRKGQPRR